MPKILPGFVKIIAINKAYSTFVNAAHLNLATDFVNAISDHLIILRIEKIFLIFLRYNLFLIFG